MTAVPPTLVPPPQPEIERLGGMLAAYIGYGLLLFSLFTCGAAGLLAMILAYDRKGQSAPLAATHFRFQLKIFWICFALTLAAGALWFGGLLSLLRSAPPPPPLIHNQPDAQLVHIADAWSQPVAAQMWSYHFDMHPAHVPGATAFQLTVGALMLAGAVLFSWIGPIFGIVRLAAGRPIGQAPDEIV
jgi:hypothetical protein